MHRANVIQSTCSQAKEAERKQAELEDARQALERKKAEEQRAEKELQQVEDQIKGARSTSQSQQSEPQTSFQMFYPPFVPLRYTAGCC